MAGMGVSDFEEGQNERVTIRKEDSSYGIETRIARLEERQGALERDVKEIKIQLNETAKKFDFERLERTITEWQGGQTKNCT